MATSGDYSFNLPSYKIIHGAARLVSAIQTGETLPSDEYEDMLDALNGMVTHWQASGIHVWSETDATLFLQPGQISYQLGLGSVDRCCATKDWSETALAIAAASGAAAITVASVAGITSGNHIGIWLDSGTIFWTTVNGAPVGNAVNLTQTLPGSATAQAWVVSYTQDMVRPLRVPAARRYQFAPPGGHPIETPLGVLSRIDYGFVPNKTTPGMVTQFFYEPTLIFGTMHIWPAPADNRSAVMFTAQRPLQDFLTQRDTADLPQEWISTLRFNLALEISPEYDIEPQRFQILQAMAAEKLAACQAWDREPQSVYFGLQAYPATRD